MSDELLNVLTRFHREVVLPDVERIVERVVDARIDPLRDEMLSNFDAVFKQLSGLKDEYHLLAGAVRRLEERMAAVEQQIEKLALRSELVELRDRVQVLEQQIARLEAQL